MCALVAFNSSHWDLENPLNNLKVLNKKYIFSSESLKICNEIASNNLKIFFFFHNLSYQVHKPN